MARYRKFRLDVLTHPKTRGLQAIDRDILFFQVIAENCAGVLRRSPEQIAKDVGGKTKAKAVRESLERLQNRGVIRWWPELELIWAVEAADEQMAKSWKAWKAVDAVVRTQPPVFQQEFRERYVSEYAHLRANDPDYQSNTVSAGYENQQTGLQEQEQEQEQKQEQRPGRGPDRERARESSSEPDERARVLAIPEVGSKPRAELDATQLVNEIRQSVNPPTPPGRKRLGKLSGVHRNLVERLLESESKADLLAAVQATARRIESGELPPKFWSSWIFSGFYPSLRDDLPIDAEGVDKSKRSNAGPQIETAEQAEAWAAEHGGWCPEGWQWLADNHGNNRAVRKERA